jgi:hypothetical protein
MDPSNEPIEPLIECFLLFQSIVQIRLGWIDTIDFKVVEATGMAENPRVKRGPKRHDYIYPQISYA